jgi:hypothetical protein
MAAPPKMTVEEARTTLETLYAASQAADPSVLAPTDWIKHLHTAGRVVATRDVQYRYRVDGILGVTIGHLSRRVTTLLDDFDGLVEDNPRLTGKK